MNVYDAGCLTNKVKVVLEADHLAALAEKDEEIAAKCFCNFDQDGLIGNPCNLHKAKDEQIAALTAENKEILDSLNAEVTMKDIYRSETFALQARIKEMQDMIAFLIVFVPNLTERNKYYDWLHERTAQKEGV